MTPEQVVGILKEYKEKLQQMPEGATRCTGSPKPLDYLAWMCEESQKFIEPDSFDRANRWLGFIQGAFWAWDIYSIEEMIQHNRSGNLGEEKA